MRRQAPELRKKIVHPIFSSSDGWQVPTWRDFSNRKFLRAVCGAGFFIIVQFGPLGLIWLIRHVGKFNTGKVILFFLLIGLLTAILLAGICIAAF